MAAFVSESREWALGVQGFLLQHCRASAGKRRPRPVAAPKARPAPLKRAYARTSAAQAASAPPRVLCRPSQRALKMSMSHLQPLGTFEPTEENRLEWHDLHAQLQAMVESLLEQQLTQLGVSVDDFVARLQACPESREGNDLLETVLSMDDFGSFKAQMLRLKRDLELLHLPDGTLNEFAPQARRA